MFKRKPYYFYSLLTIFIIPTFIFGYLIIDEISIFAVLILAVICLIAGALWDTWATKHGWKDKFWLWTFNEKYMLGPKIFGIPIEEYGFFFFGATFLVTLYEFILNIFENSSSQGWLIFIVIIIWSFSAIILPKLKEPN